MASIDPARALTFGRLADEYERWRPGYPDEAVEWLAPRAPARVADVGAGTGKLTAQLLQRGLEVESVDPDPAMLAVLERANPRAVGHSAAADALPFDYGSWHWFPIDTAVAEVRRTLSPGGWLGLVWNHVTPVEWWEVALAALDPDQKGFGKPEPAPLPFPETETGVATFPWTWHLTPQHFRGYLSTNSAVIGMEEGQRRDRLDSATDLLVEVCAALGSTTVPLHHEAACLEWSPR